MKTIPKIIGLICAFGLAFSAFAPFTMAQSSLDAIKARLESEGIQVVDYSSPTGQWGSLSTEWVRYLSGKFTSMSDLAKPLKKYFIGDGSLTDLRRKLDLAVAAKNSLTLQSDIDKKDSEISDLNSLIEAQTTAAKGTIMGMISDSTLDKTGGANLIFNEVDFYYNYQKWGRLPVRIIGLLEDASYQSLQDVVDIAGGADQVPAKLAQIKDLSADDIQTIVDSIAILNAPGERQLLDIARSVTDIMKNLVAGLAVIWIVYAGARLIFAQGDESIINEQKRAFFYGLLGLVAILLIGKGVDLLYGPAGVTRTSLTQAQGQGFSTEVLGLVTFLKAVVGIIAILFIIVSGVRMLFAVGEESEITKQRTALLWIGVGLVIIAVDQVVIENIFTIPVSQSNQIKTSNITSLINTMGSVLQFLLGFVGLIAFGILVFGAASLIANYGDEQMVEKAKKIIKNAIYGLLIIISAYTLVATLVVFK